MSQHQQALHTSTQQLYIVFKPYQDHELPSYFGYLKSYTQELNHTSLAELSVSQLTPFIRDLKDYDNASQVLRRFLPRILELSIDGYDRWCFGLDRVFLTLVQMDWQSWPATEIEAVTTFLHGFWDYHLHEVYPSGTSSSADTILEAIGQITPLDPFLTTWSTMNHRYALGHIAHLAVYGKKHHRAVRRWLAQPAILQSIEAAFWDCNDSDNAALFSKAAEYLRLSDDHLVPA